MRFDLFALARGRTSTVTEFKEVCGRTPCMPPHHQIGNKNNKITHRQGSRLDTLV